MTTHLPMLTSSSARTFRRCAREYQHRYAQGYRPAAQAETARFGTLVHVGLETWWRAQQSTAEAMEWLYLAVDAMQAARPEALDGAKALALLTSYHARWEIDAPRYEVLHVEAVYHAPLVNPATGAPSRTFERAGKVDAIVRERESGRVLVVEHKTTSEPFGVASDYWARLTLDAQVSHYMEGAQALGVKPDACLYDVLRRPQLELRAATPEASRRYTAKGLLDARQRTEDETIEAYAARLQEDIAASPDKYFRRGEVVRLEHDVDEARYDDWQTARNIRDAELAARWPRNPDGCIRYGRRCEYWGVCTHAESLDDPEKFALVEPHEELRTTPAEAPERAA